MADYQGHRVTERHLGNCQRGWRGLLSDADTLQRAQPVLASRMAQRPALRFPPCGRDWILHTVNVGPYTVAHITPHAYGLFGWIWLAFSPRDCLTILDKAIRCECVACSVRQRVEGQDSLFYPLADIPCSRSHVD